MATLTMLLLALTGLIAPGQSTKIREAGEEREEAGSVSSLARVAEVVTTLGRVKGNEVGGHHSLNDLELILCPISP